MFVLDGWVSPNTAYYYLTRKEYEAASLESNGAEGDLILKSDRAFATFLRGPLSAQVLLADGSSVKVDETFIKSIEKTHPFRHRYFDLKTGMIGYRPINQRGSIFDQTLDIALPSAVVFLVFFLFIATTYLSLPIETLSSRQLFVIASFFGLIPVSVWFATNWMNRHRAVAVECGPYRGAYLMFAKADINRFIEAYYPKQHEEADVEESLTEVAESLPPKLNQTEKRALEIVRLFDKAQEEGRRLTKLEASQKIGQGSVSSREFDRIWSSASSYRPELGKPGRPKRQG